MLSHRPPGSRLPYEWLLAAAAAPARWSTDLGPTNGIARRSRAIPDQCRDDSGSRRERRVSVGDRGQVRWGGVRGDPSVGCVGQAVRARSSGSVTSSTTATVSTACRGRHDRPCIKPRGWASRPSRGRWGSRGTWCVPRSPRRRTEVRTEAGRVGGRGVRGRDPGAAGAGADDGRRR